MNVLNTYREVFEATLRDNLDKGNSNASYALNKSIKTRIEVKGKEFIVICNILDYYKYVDQGTSPHFPPIDAIKKWIEVKPVNPYPTSNGKLPTVNQLAYLIARKISRVGTKGTNFFTDARERTEDKYRAEIRKAITKDVSQYIMKQLKGLKETK